MKFVHRFSGRITCTLEVSDNPPEAGVSHVRGCVWSSQPKRKHLTEYLFWMHSVNSHLANLWKKKIGYLVQRSDSSWEFWNYEPGQAPKRVPISELSELTNVD